MLLLVLLLLGVVVLLLLGVVVLLLLFPLLLLQVLQLVPQVMRQPASAAGSGCMPWRLRRGGRGLLLRRAGAGARGAAPAVRGGSLLLRACRLVLPAGAQGAGRVLGVGRSAGRGHSEVAGKGRHGGGGVTGPAACWEEGPSLA